MTPEPRSGRPPLDGLLVVDVSRMVPGAVVARSLLDLGARLVKIEDPGRGDPLRAAPPHVGGVSAGFSVFFRGAESITIDLRDPEGVADLAQLLARADLFIESFRPGALARFGVDLAACEAANPRLITLSLPAAEADEQVTGHDLNFVALTGLLHLLAARGSSSPTIPPVQVADVSAALLATSSVLAALLVRERDGHGQRVVQPLLSGPLPFVTWPWADTAAGGGGMGTMLTGSTPSYRIYLCADQRPIALACLEPKLWTDLCARLDVAELAGVGLDAGPAGQAAAGRIAAIFAEQPLEHWLARLTGVGLPISPVNDLGAALHEPALRRAGLLEETPMADGSRLLAPGPAIFHFGRTPARPAPRLGQQDDDLRREFGLSALSPSRSRRSRAGSRESP